MQLDKSPIQLQKSNLSEACVPPFARRSRRDGTSCFNFHEANWFRELERLAAVARASAGRMSTTGHFRPTLRVASSFPRKRAFPVPGSNANASDPAVAYNGSTP